MTDKEIINASECCKKDDCDNCPNDFGNCYANLSGYAIDLINRQKAEIDELKHEREVLIEDIHHFVDKNNEQLEEIEKLERIISYLEGVCESTPDKVRVEVVKEFADRLLNKVRVVQVSNLTWVWLISQDDINDIIKEMLGEE